MKKKLKNFYLLFLALIYEHLTTSVFVVKLIFGFIGQFYFLAKFSQFFFFVVVLLRFLLTNEIKHDKIKTKNNIKI